MRVPKKLPSYMLGRLGEGLAKQYLVSHGYDVLSMNFACKIGEVDIIALKECTMAFVEVKTRTAKPLGPPLEAVDYRKQRRLKRIAQYYMSLIATKFGSTDSFQVRFDVATVIVDWPRGGELYYLEDAFS
jgi:putative endonuclease